MAAPAPSAADEWPFYARREEFEVLTGLVAAADQERDGDEPAGATVVAAAGVGKTRLLREIQGWAKRRHIPTSMVIGTKAAATTPYGAMLHLVPDQTRRGHPDATSWYRAFADSLRPGRRRLLLVDDAHLLDPGSADLVLHLALEEVITPLVAIRRGEPVADAITTLWKDGYALRVDLQPFSSREIKELLGQVLGGEISSRTGEQLARMVQGNVLYARELVTGAVQSGSLETVDGVWRWNGKVDLAPRLLDAVGQRLAGLSVADQHTLAIVALAEPLPLAVAERAAELDSIGRIEDAGLVRVSGDGTGELWLNHPLYGEVILSRIGTMTRRRLLRRLADGLEQDPAGAGLGVLRIASWRLEAGGEVSAAMLTTAATMANLGFDHARAERLARGALARGGGPAASVELGRALIGENRYQEADDVLAAVETTILTGPDRELHRGYLDGRYRALHLGLGRMPETQAMLDRFLQAHRGVEPDHARTAEAQIRAYGANVALIDARPLAAIEAAQSLCDDPTTGSRAQLMALETCGEALIYVGQYARAAQIRAQLLQWSPGDEHGPASAVAEATLLDVLAKTANGQVAQALPVVTAIHEAMMHSPDAINRGLSALALGKCLIHNGKPVTARRVLLDAASAFRTAEIGGSLTWTLSVLSQGAALVGNVEAARRRLTESVQRAAPSRIARNEEDAAAAAVWLAVADGDATGAARIALRAADQLAEMLLPQASLLHLSLRVGGSASTVRSRLLGIAEACDSECDYPRLLADHAAALADDDAAALEQVADRFAGRGLILHAAEAAAQASAGYTRAQMPSAAARTALRSRTLADACEGARTPALNEVTAPLPQLSRREREVARLAANGLSNAAIAERLVLSVRTVESHLYQAYAKLGVDRREDLARYLGENQ